MKPCKHLYYNVENYPSCTLLTLREFPKCVVKYWRRDEVPYEGAPVNVQFCGAGRGRINGIFQCYQRGEMSCYEPTQDSAA